MEHSLEQTSSQMLRIEQEISSIESANINKETLDAMTNAGKAMKQIHNGMTLDKVDSAMYVPTSAVDLSLAILSFPFPTPAPSSHHFPDEHAN